VHEDGRRHNGWTATTRIVRLGADPVSHPHLCQARGVVISTHVIVTVSLGLANP
jgi:hypothetical protein